jgi:predicted nucleic acid-binding protein
MKIYFDNCCYNRPFDEKTLITIQLESDAKILIQHRVNHGIYDVVWSYMNEYENNFNPYKDRRHSIQKWAEHNTKEFCYPSDIILKRGEKIQKLNIRKKDALHLACAIESSCDYFITTDYLLIRKNKLFSEIRIINPINFLLEMEDRL